MPINRGLKFEDVTETRVLFGENQGKRTNAKVERRREGGRAREGGRERERETDRETTVVSYGLVCTMHNRGCYFDCYTNS